MRSESARTSVTPARIIGIQQTSHLSPLTVPDVPGVPDASGVRTDPYCGLRARLIRYQNQLESNLAVVEAGKSLVESTPAVSSLPRILDGFSAAVASVREG